ncbi:peptidase [Streptomyces montanus]|uniref:peptidase n=1 Tax=Streptomyces montanus TaxID=2580423 RepID=UPI001BB2CC71|nr:peptidase [Streptomyces montanus]
MPRRAAPLLLLLLLTALVQGAVSSDANATGDAPGGSGGPGEPKGTFGLRLLDAPVVRRDDPRAYTSVVDHLNPGATIERRVEVANKSPNPLRVSLYAAAASIKNGKFTFAAGRSKNELSEWTSLDRPVLTLPPESRETARFRIQVPRWASRGERYAVIWAEAASSGKGNIKLVNRVGTRLYLDVGPGGEPPSAFRIEKLTPARSPEGKPQLTAQVRNTGERALEMSGKLWLSKGPAGLSAGPYLVARGTTLAPGDTGSVSVALDDKLPNGPWKAKLTLASGRVRETATATVSFPSPGMWGASIAPDIANFRQWPPLLSWGLAAMTAILAALGVRRLKWRRARRRS